MKLILDVSVFQLYLIRNAFEAYILISTNCMESEHEYKYKVVHKYNIKTLNSYIKTINNLLENNNDSKAE